MKLNNLPVVIFYVVYPFVGIFQNFTNTSFEKDVILLLLLGVLVLAIAIKLVKRETKLSKKIAYLIGFCVLIVLFKFILPLPIVQSQPNLFIVFVHIKIIVFLVTSLLAINFLGFPDEEWIIKGGKFFSFLYILFAIVYLGIGDFHRFGIASESNYDGVLILISYIYTLRNPKFNLEKILLSIGTILTFSRTGLLAWLVINIFYYWRRYSWVSILTLFSIPLLIEALAAIRGKSVTQNFDRLIFWNQFYHYLKNASLLQYLFGNIPLEALRINTLVPGMKWFINNFQQMNNIKGIYPFMFHSFWIRSAISFGVIPVVSFLSYLGYKFFSTKNEVLKSFIILILIQGLSMSLFYVSLTGIMLFIVFFKETRFINSYKVSILKNSILTTNFANMIR